MLFNLFKRKNQSVTETPELSESDKKWNKMWELWSDGKIESPYDELMNYHGEVNNGGHYQYFLNIEGNGDINKEITAVCSVVPSFLKNNIHAAFESYAELERDENVDRNEITLRKCDECFFENENIINDILRNYCEKLSY